MKDFTGRIKSACPKVNLGSLIIIVLVFVLGWQLGHKDYAVRIENYKPNVKITNQTPQGKNVDIDFKLFWRFSFDQYSNEIFFGFRHNIL